jgi:hypothetical protein
MTRATEAVNFGLGSPEASTSSSSTGSLFQLKLIQFNHLRFAAKFAPLHPARLFVF